MYVTLSFFEMFCNPLVCLHRKDILLRLRMYAIRNIHADGYVYTQKLNIVAFKCAILLIRVVDYIILCLYYNILCTSCM